MFCPKCGQGLESGTKFCTKCGYDMTSAQSEQPAAQTPPSQPVNQAPVQQQAYAATPQQPVYQTSPQTPPAAAINKPQPDPALLDKPLTMWQYLGIFLLCAVPILGIILIFKWAFGSSANTNKKNYARAVLIMFLIGIVLSIVFSVLYGSILMSLFKLGNSMPVN